MNRNPVLFGTAVALLSVAARAQIIYSDPPSALDWPAGALGNAATRIESGQLTPDGVEDVIVLLGNQLWLLHSPGLAPSFQLVATGCADFALLPKGGPGMSDVVFSRSDGLWRCSWNASLQQLLPVDLIDDSAWISAKHLSACPAAAPYAATVAGVGASGDTLLLGYLGDTHIVTKLSCSAGTPVLDAVALEFKPALPGTEIAYATATAIAVLDDTGATVSGPHAVLDGFLRLGRNQYGGTDADSLIGLLQFNFSGSMGEVVMELDRFGWSQALFCGTLGLRDIHLGKVGADALQDVIASSATLASAWTLHGTPHNPQIIPFAPVAGELFQIPFSGVASYPSLANPRAVAGDFDHDGQNDIALIGSNRDQCFVMARNFDPGDVNMDATVEVTTLGPLDGFHLNFGITVNTGWASAEQPNQAIFEVWLRDPPPSFVQPGPWITRTVALTGDGQYPAISLEGDLPAGFDVGNGLFYLRVHVKRVDGTTTVLRSTATFWVHSFNEEVLESVLCEEQDAFGGCPPDNGPIVQGFNRRANVRPFQDGISPYGNGQVPP